MAEKITVKSGSYASDPRDRNKGKRKRQLLIATHFGLVFGNIAATQYIAHTLKYAAALGGGIRLGSEFTLYSPHKWIVWLMQLISHYSLQNPTVMKMSCISVLLVFAFTLFPALILKQKERARKEREKLENVQGSARWARKEDIQDCGLLPPDGQTMDGVYVGGWWDEKAKKHRYLMHNGPEHILAYAPTRSGKGVGLVLPTLLNWKHSCIVLDIKGENYSLTSGWRHDHADNYILKFDPLDTTGTAARYNPLNEIRMATEYEHADIENLSMMLADPTGKGSEGDNAHWVTTSSSLLICLIYHMLYKCKADGTEPTLEMLRGMFTDPEKDFQKQTLEEIRVYDHNPDVPEKEIAAMTEEQIAYRLADRDERGNAKVPSLYKWKVEGKENEFFYTRFNFGADAQGRPLRTHPKAAMNAKEAQQRGEKEAATVLSTASNALKLYADPTISKNLKNATFKLFDLMNADKPVSLYLCVPPAQLGRIIPILRIMITQVVTILADSMYFVEGQAKGKFIHKMLLLLDEFPVLGNMEIFETSLAFIAGYGLKSYLIIQDLKQLYKRYTDKEGIISNCHVQIMYAPNNIDTAKTISEQLGTTTVIKETVSTSTTKGQKTISKSLQEQQRPLMTVQEVMALKGPLKDAQGMIKEPGEMIVKVAGFFPILGRQILYFLDPTFSKRSKMPCVPRSDIMMFNLRRAYMRPEYKWLSDAENEANRAEDEANVPDVQKEIKEFWKNGGKYADEEQKEEVKDVPNDEGAEQQEQSGEGSPSAESAAPPQTDDAAAQKTDEERGLPQVIQAQSALAALGVEDDSVAKMGFDEAASFYGDEPEEDDDEEGSE